MLALIGILFLMNLLWLLVFRQFRQFRERRLTRMAFDICSRSTQGRVELADSCWAASLTEDYVLGAIRHSYLPRLYSELKRHINGCSECFARARRVALMERRQLDQLRGLIGD